METILGRTRRPDIKFYKNGKIEISSRITKQLSLHAGDSIDIGWEDGECYLIGKNVASYGSRHEACCMPTNPGGNFMRAYSKRLCDAMMRDSSAPHMSFVTGQIKDHPIHGVIVTIINRPFS